MTMNLLRHLAYAALAFCTGTSAAVAQTPTSPSHRPTVVLVHGAFGSVSDWDRVIPILEDQGLEVIAVQLPLTSLADDAAATERAIDRAAGPVVLVGHSWGGTVITEAGVSGKVRSLVYVAAFANKTGESDVEMGAPYPHAPGLDQVQVDGQGFARLNPTGMSDFFAPQASAQIHRLMWATQGPIRKSSFATKVDRAAWQNKPNWFVIATQDKMVVPEMQEAVAKRIDARVTRLNSDHVPMRSYPAEVAKVILEAAKSGSTGH